MHIILWHGTNAHHTMAWYKPMHVILWHGTNAHHTSYDMEYQCMSYYGMVPMHTTLAMTWYKPMHIILWHGTNAAS